MLSERLEKIKFNSNDLTIEEILVQGASSSKFIENLENLEEDLTRLEHSVMIACGYANVPEEIDQSGGFQNILYAMAASMVGADGKLEQEEIVTAEEIGAKLTNNFDKTDFRAYCNNLDDIPDIFEVAKELIYLDKEQKKMIYSFLEKIANADADLAEEELIILNKLKEIWSIN